MQVNKIKRINAGDKMNEIIAGKNKIILSRMHGGRSKIRSSMPSMSKK